MIYMPTVTMSMEEYLALVQGLDQMQTQEFLKSQNPEEPAPKKTRTRSSKYSRTYKREFKRIAPIYKQKNGKWKKDGFKRTVRAAHRAARKILG
jgi:hypothetical protein